MKTQLDIFRTPLPDFQRVDYLLLPDSDKWYQRTLAPVGFNRMPEQLTVEETQDRDNIKADKIVRGRQRLNQYLFFTGIRPTPHPRLFVGNDYNSKSKKRSLVLFAFSRDNVSMAVFYFRSIMKKGKPLENFLTQFIKKMETGKL